MTLFLSCLGRLLCRRSEGSEPRLLVVVTQEVCWSRMLEEFALGPRMLGFEEVMESARIRLEGAEPLLLARQDFSAIRRNAFSFSSSTLFLELQMSSATTSMLQFCSGSLFSFDWRSRLDSMQTLVGRLMLFTRPRLGFRELRV